MKDHQAPTIVQAMMEYIARYGNIDELLCDLDSEFQSLLFETFTFSALNRYDALLLIRKAMQLNAGIAH